MDSNVLTPEEYAAHLLGRPMFDRGISDRVKRIQESIRISMGQPKKLWDDVGSILNEDTAKESIIVRKALAMKRKFEIVPIGIWKEQLIAGSFTLPEKGIALSGRLPDYATREEIEEAGMQGVTVYSIVGHIVPHYKKLLDQGVCGIIGKAENSIKDCSEKDKVDFYRAVLIVLEGLVNFAERHALCCETLAQSVRDPMRKRELQDMASDLRYCPSYPPQNLRQALNAIWLTHLAFQITGNNLAIGRADQYIASFLEADIREGRLSIEQAQELMDCFFLKFNERSLDNRIIEKGMDKEKIQEANNKKWSNRSPFDHSTQKTNIRDSIDATNHWLQNIIIGGVRAEDGKDGTTLATLMCLEAFGRNKMTNPCFTVRLHKDSPRYLVDVTARVLMDGGGLPAIFNDDAIIPSLTNSGFPVEDARDYTNDGCWEVIIPGRTDFYFDRFNALKCLEWVFNRGRSSIDGKEEAPDLGDPRRYTSYMEIMDAFKHLLDYQLEGIMVKITSQFGRRAVIAPTPLLSALMEGPMESGVDMTAGGAKYITYGLIAEGMSHLIDSLAAVKKVVFEDKTVALSDLVKAIHCNFEGYQDVRQKLNKAPKYGSNDPYADDIGQEILHYFASKVRDLNRKYNKIKFLPGVGTFSWYIAIGEGLGASPDGRLRAQAVSSNFSPSAGAAVRGVTGAILSHSKMNMNELPVGSPIDLRLARRLVEGQGGHERLTGLIRSFIELGGNMLTLTIEDTETLRKAQQDPDNYRDLRVRMGGWSAYFTMLSEAQQEHHINKQENL